MMKRPLKATLRVGAVLLASTALLTFGNVLTFRPAGADPSFVSSYVGVGSDTIQDLFNAYSGAEPYPGPANSGTKFYTPLSTTNATGNKTISSFDAIPAGGSSSAPGCITTRLGGPSFDRPNGSGNGIAALSHAIDGTGWQASTASCTAGTSNATPSVQGQIDFARSSRGPKTAGTALNFIPFARDAVSYAYFDHGANLINALTTAQLNALYTSTTGTITVGTETVEACLTQAGSGTTSFWETAIGVTDAQAQAAATAAGCNGEEENGANTFYGIVSSLPANHDAVIDFSVGSWIAQANGAALDRSGTARSNGVDLGNIDNDAGAGLKPYSGSPGTEAPNTAFYQNAQYGRNLYVVVSSAKIGGFGDAGLKSLFVGTGSAICSSAAQTTANKFGFDSLSGSEGTCGDTTLSAGGKQGALYS